MVECKPIIDLLSVEKTDEDCSGSDNPPVTSLGDLAVHWPTRGMKGGQWTTWIICLQTRVG